eukprot:788764-Amorphochlora_amoeboformis.AAC.2
MQVGGKGPKSARRKRRDDTRKACRSHATTCTDVFVLITSFTGQDAAWATAVLSWHCIFPRNQTGEGIGDGAVGERGEAEQGINGRE